MTIVSTMIGDRDYGTTVSACTSLSLEPPMLAVCLNRQSSTRNAILANGRFGVSILTADQADVAAHFARKGDDKFDCLQPVRGPLGMPLIRDSLSHIECDVADMVAGGSHTIVLGCVRYAVGAEGDPLTYFRGRMGRFEADGDSPVGARTS
ncbi:flavin reductase family protein [Mycolicibacterium neoaurum]|uniref:flavin reductase family protein n=1 Tax=Mycolicibacterium neoaurum TaxID=1795 RepID=UPI001F4CDB54